MRHPIVTATNDDPKGTWYPPRVVEIKPHPMEVGVTRFVMYVDFKGEYTGGVNTDEAIQTAKSLVELSEAIKRANEAEARALESAERMEFVRDQYSKAIRRVDELTWRRANEIAARAHRRANDAEAELCATQKALAKIGSLLRAATE